MEILFQESNTRREDRKEKNILFYYRIRNDLFACLRGTCSILLVP